MRLIHFMASSVAMKNSLRTRKATAEGLVRAPDLIVELFPNPKSRPTIRTIRRMTATGKIPFVRFGRGIFFNVPDVRSTLMKQETAKSI